jgi:hypothetical protein
MYNRIPQPELFVVAHADVADGGRWVSDLWRLCTGVVGELSAVDVVDERQLNVEGDIGDAVLIITAPVPSEGIQRLAEELRAKLVDGVNARLVVAVHPDSVHLDSSQISVEHFRREFAVNSQMVAHVDSCVKLTHLPSGTVARSTRHRSRALNREQARLLLESLVSESQNVA